MIDDDLAHRTRGNREEMFAIGDRDVAVLREFFPGFVDERRRVRGFAAQLSGREPVQLAIERREQCIGRGTIPAACLPQHVGVVDHVLPAATVPRAGTLGKKAVMKAR